MKLYKIKITNWMKHNSQIKKSHKYTLIANNFCSDPKLNALPMSHGWLFLGLVLIAGDTMNDTVTITERQVNDLLRTKVGAQNALHALESFQLVTVEELESPLINRTKEKRREEKGKEVQAEFASEPPPAVEPISLKPDPPEPKSKPHPLIEFWNQERGPFSAIKLLSETRERKVASQFKKNPDLRYWRDVLNRWKQSQFCIEQWKPNFDDLLNESKRISTLEGKYDNRPATGGHMRFKPPERPAIKFPDAEQVLAEQRAAAPDGGHRGDPESAARVRELLAKAGNLGVRSRRDEPVE